MCARLRRRWRRRHLRHITDGAAPPGTATRRGYGPAMEIVRVYTGADGQSHFEDVTVELEDFGMAGQISALWPGRGVQFRTVSGDYSLDFHTAPRRPARCQPHRLGRDRGRRRHRSTSRTRIDPAGRRPDRSGSHRPQRGQRAACACSSTSTRRTSKGRERRRPQGLRAESALLNIDGTEASEIRSVS